MARWSIITFVQGCNLCNRRAYWRWVGWGEGAKRWKQFRVTGAEIVALRLTTGRYERRTFYRKMKRPVQRGRQRRTTLDAKKRSGPRGEKWAGRISPA